MYFLPASQKRLLNSLNPLFVVFLAFGLILIRTTMDPLLNGVLRRVDILLPIVVYLGQRRTLAEGMILALFTSHLYSLCSAAPIGVFTTHYLIIFVISRLLSYVTYVTRWFTVMLLMFALSILSHFQLALIAQAFGHGWPLFGDGFHLLERFVVTAFGGYLIYLSMEILDKVTFKVPRINIELAEGHL